MNAYFGIGGSGLWHGASFPDDQLILNDAEDLVFQEVFKGLCPCHGNGKPLCPFTPVKIRHQQRPLGRYTVDGMNAVFPESFNPCVHSFVLYFLSYSKPVFKLLEPLSPI